MVLAVSVDKDFKFKLMASLLHGGLPLFSVTILCCIFSVWPAEEIFLSLNGDSLVNNSYVDIDNITEDSRLICGIQTNNCSESNRFPQVFWFLPNGTNITSDQSVSGYYTENITLNATILHRNTTEIPSQVQLGKFCCLVQCSSDQTLCVNILNIGVVSISLSPPLGNSTKLRCSTTITPLISNDNVPFEWFHDQNYNGSLPADVDIMLRNNGNMYTSTLHFPPLLNQSHTGIYTCQIGRNARLAAEFTFTIAISTVSISSSGTATAGESYSLVCSVTVTESNEESVEPMIMWLGIGNFTGNFLVSESTKYSSMSEHDPDIYSKRLTFGSLVVLNSGTYVCKIIAGQVIITKEFRLHVNVVDAQVIMTPNTTNGETGFILCCNISGINNLNSSTITYQWQKDNSTVSAQDEPTLSLFPLRASHAGRYTCQATVNSTSLSSPITVNSNSQIVNIQLPAPTTVNISHSMISVGANVTLNCTVELNPLVDVLVTVNTVWTGPDGFMTTNTAWPVMGSTTNYTSTAMVSSFGREQSGNYTCRASINSMPPFLNGSTPASETARVSVGVYLSLKGVVVYANNSAIQITEIGETNTTSNTGLQCITDRMPCCASVHMMARAGEWYFPNGTRVPVVGTVESGDKATSFYRNRGDDGTVNLNRVNTNVVMPTGLFCCMVPDALNVMQRLCANIFSIKISLLNEHGEAENLPVTVGGRTYTLICNVSGADIITYQWTKDGCIVNETRANLSFSPLRLSDAGQYSCEAINTVEHNITLLIPPPSSITITTNPIVKSIWPVGSNITLICTVEMTPVILESELSLLTVDAQLSRDGTPLRIPTRSRISGTTFTYTTHLNFFDRSDSGNYTCNITLRSRQPSFIIEDELLTSDYNNIIKISTGVFLSWNGSGVVIANNSNITLNDDALLCFTDLNECCSSDTAQVAGDWFFPNGSVVGNQTTSSNIYIERGPSVVGLYWNDSATFPTGMYRCEIPDASGILRNVSVGIYSAKDNINFPGATSNSTATVAGAVVGVLLVLVLIVAVSALVVVFGMGRIKMLGSVKLKPHHGIRCRKPLKDYGTHSVAKPHQHHDGEDKNEGVELDETNTDKDKDYYFMDTTLIAGEHVKPIPVSEFSGHVERLHADRDKLFEMEYESVSKHPQSSYSVAEIPHNKLKNRFANIFPYDSSRVKLKEISGEDGSDYINASHLDGYNKPKAYIGAQGPMPNTVNEFWRMIWEKKLPTVVMLTRVFEGRKKCEEYWPLNVGESVQPGHGLTITLNSTLPFAEYSLRKMTLTCSTALGSAPLKVTQYHFTGWPDHGVPQNGVTLINFIRRVRTSHPYSDSRPLLVHCSAGVGRTGAFIVLDSMLQRMQGEQNLNIYEFLKQLRTQRVLMVQTQAQYNFIHDALNELILCGDTEITAPNLRIVISQLNKTTDGETGYTKQFNLIAQMSPGYSESDYTQANMECNLSKNRYPNVLPNDRHRVLLRAAAGSDYLNASFIDGYRQRGGYIATQAPMENTVNDFWRMVWDYQSRAIVLLCRMKEDGKEACCPFLPEHKGDSEVYGKIRVQLVSKETTTDYVIQQLEVSEDKSHPQGQASSEAAVKVGVFHYIRWPKHGTPRGTAALLDLIQHINKTQMTSGNKPITVMCNDGVGRTGTFICIHAQLERLKTEGVVDFFQSIKSARIQRAGLVPDVYQYILCHNLVADYLDGFDTYANFKELV